MMASPRIDNGGLEQLPSATRAVEVLRHEDTGQASTQHWAQDRIICEHPVALVFNGVSHAVMMATPTDLEDFGVGFALSEGVIDTVADCHDIELASGPEGTELRMQISTRAFSALQTQRRMMAGRTGCGLCGIDSLRALAGRHPARPAQGQVPPSIAPATISLAISQLHAHQALQADTGGCHAAAWADAHGRVQALREDVGRHNALDKLIGHLARNGQMAQARAGLVLMSSRASHELVSKCARVGLATLATVSAPTSMAVDLARETGVQLYGFCRDRRAVHYTVTKPG